MSSSDYFSNVMSMFRHFRSNLYHFLLTPLDLEVYTWSLIAFPFTVNAFHLQQLNSIGRILLFLARNYECFKKLCKK